MMMSIKLKYRSSGGGYKIMWIKQCKILYGDANYYAEDRANEWVKNNPQFKIGGFTYYKVDSKYHAAIFIEYEEYVLESETT